MKKQVSDEERRDKLAKLTNSSAFSEEEARGIKQWARSPEAFGRNLFDAYIITLQKVQAHDKSRAPVANRIDSLCRKIVFHAGPVEADLVKRGRLKKRTLIEGE